MQYARYLRRLGRLVQGRRGSSSSSLALPDYEWLLQPRAVAACIEAGRGRAGYYSACYAALFSLCEAGEHAAAQALYKKRAALSIAPLAGERSALGNGRSARLIKLIFVICTLQLKAHDLLLATRRDTGGDSYLRLREAFERLAGTRITTNIVTAGVEATSGFGLIESWEILRHSRGRDEGQGQGAGGEKANGQTHDGSGTQKEPEPEPCRGRGQAARVRDFP
jgi:hypothetical protein